MKANLVCIRGNLRSNVQPPFYNWFPRLDPLPSQVRPSPRRQELKRTGKAQCFSCAKVFLRKRCSNTSSEIDVLFGRSHEISLKSAYQAPKLPPMLGWLSTYNFNVASSGKWSEYRISFRTRVLFFFLRSDGDTK